MNALFEETTEPIREFVDEHRFLSNFWREPVLVTGPWWTDHIACNFATVEHAYQAAKVEPGEAHFSEHYGRIARAAGPGEAKRLGQPKAFAEAGATCRAEWDQIKVMVMLQCLRCKFEGAPGNPASALQLGTKLIATSPRILIEGNTWGDDFWGVVDRGHGRGHNMLGRLLMYVRAELQVSRASGLWPQELRIRD